MTTDQSKFLCRGLVGDSVAVSQVRDLIQKIAPSRANILISGETGSGKEIVARNIHYHSDQSDGPFVPINCSAIPADLLESELFGHIKGAFTGATSDRDGRFMFAAELIYPINTALRPNPAVIAPLIPRQARTTAR
jgi:sigma-54 specific flagellar transcriptional regulator A